MTAPSDQCPLYPRRRTLAKDHVCFVRAFMKDCRSACSKWSRPTKKPPVLPLKALVASNHRHIKRTRTQACSRLPEDRESRYQRSAASAPCRAICEVRRTWSRTARSADVEPQVDPQVHQPRPDRRNYLRNVIYRNDTLMQDRSPPTRQNLLATHGRTIHLGHKRTSMHLHLMSALHPKAERGTMWASVGAIGSLATSVRKPALHHYGRHATHDPRAFRRAA
jgi:hypothetical protein